MIIYKCMNWTYSSVNTCSIHHVIDGPPFIRYVQSPMNLHDFVLLFLQNKSRTFVLRSTTLFATLSSYDMAFVLQTKMLSLKLDITTEDRFNVIYDGSQAACKQSWTSVASIRISHCRVTNLNTLVMKLPHDHLQPTVSGTSTFRADRIINHMPH